MAMRFFRQLAPAIPVVLSNGRAVRFKSADGVRFYQAINEDAVSKEFEDFMAQQRYGLTEVTAEEFQTEFVQKKTTPGSYRPPWREEFGAGAVVKATQLSQAVSQSGSAAAAVAVEKSDITRFDDHAMEATLPRGPLPSVVSAGPDPAKAREAFSPPVGPRTRAPAKAA